MAEARGVARAWVEAQESLAVVFQEVGMEDETGFRVLLADSVKLDADRVEFRLRSNIQIQRAHNDREVERRENIFGGREEIEVH